MNHKDFFKKHGDQKIKLFQSGEYITVNELVKAAIEQYKAEKKVPKKQSKVEAGSDI